ncbi:MAG: hypothetical protein E7017_01385 [Alphaproteobacteria bacterium]|nr:hypothetical protein [Alphaproteobacteria bacterium]
MYTKYEKIQGEVAFRLWMFGLALAELERNPIEDKAGNLLGKVKAFAMSEIVQKQASQEQKEDLQKVIQRLLSLL